MTFDELIKHVEDENWMYDNEGVKPALGLLRSEATSLRKFVIEMVEINNFASRWPMLNALCALCGREEDV